jgi:hypothetical protein
MSSAVFNRNFVVIITEGDNKPYAGIVTPEHYKAGDSDLFIKRVVRSKLVAARVPAGAGVVATKWTGLGGLVVVAACDIKAGWLNPSIDDFVDAEAMASHVADVSSFISWHVEEYLEDSNERVVLNGNMDFVFMEPFINRLGEGAGDVLLRRIKASVPVRRADTRKLDQETRQCMISALSQEAVVKYAAELFQVRYGINDGALEPYDLRRFLTLMLELIKVMTRKSVIEFMDQMAGRLPSDPSQTSELFKALSERGGMSVESIRDGLNL